MVADQDVAAVPNPASIGGTAGGTTAGGAPAAGSQVDVNRVIGGLLGAAGTLMRGGGEKPARDQAGNEAAAVLSNPPMTSTDAGAASSPIYSGTSPAGAEVAVAAATPATGAAPAMSRAIAAVNVDIVGIKLGMSFDEVKRALQVHSPAMRAEEARGIVNNVAATDYLSWVIARGAQRGTDGSGDAIGVQFPPPPNAHRAIFVERFTGFQANQYPLFETLRQALVQKYGAPSFASEGVMLWTFNCGRCADRRQQRQRALRQVSADRSAGARSERAVQRLQDCGVRPDRLCALRTQPRTVRSRPGALDERVAGRRLAVRGHAAGRGALCHASHARCWFTRCRAQAVNCIILTGGSMKRLVHCTTFVLAAMSSPAWAQSKSDIQRMQPYLGVLAPDCSNYMLPQLKHLGDSLVVQDGGKAVLTGRNVKPAPKYFGATPPPEFETAYTSEVAGGEASGVRVLPQCFGSVRRGRGRTEGDGRAAGSVQGQARPALRPEPQRRAGGGSAERAGKSRSEQVQGLRADRTDRVRAALQREGERYVLQSAGSANQGAVVGEAGRSELEENRPVKVAGADYMLGGTCKNHDCFENNVVLLYSGAQDVVYGKVYQRGKSTLIGSPPPAVATELERLWKSEFRSQPK